MWSFIFLENLMECTLLWVDTNQQSRQSGSSPLNTGAERGIEILIALVNKFSQHSPISATSDVSKHIFLFIENFLLSLELGVIIHAHSTLTVFEKFSEDSPAHKCLPGIQLNSTSCAAGRILCLFKTDTSDNKLPMIINHSFRPFNLADTGLLVNPLISLKLQRRYPFQHTAE